MTQQFTDAELDADFKERTGMTFADIEALSPEEAHHILQTPVPIDSNHSLTLAEFGARQLRRWCDRTAISTEQKKYFLREARNLLAPVVEMAIVPIDENNIEDIETL